MDVLQAIKARDGDLRCLDVAEGVDSVDSIDGSLNETVGTSNVVLDARSQRRRDGSNNSVQLHNISLTRVKGTKATHLVDCTNNHGQASPNNKLQETKED